MRIRYFAVGVDISAGWFDVCLPISRKQHEARFDNTQAGIQQFLDWCKALGALHLHVCMESTGGYEKLLAMTLYNRGYRVSVIDGFQSKRYAESLPGKGKSDRSDARSLARYVKERRPALWLPVPDKYLTLAELTRHRDDLVDSRTQWTNRSLAPQSNPYVKQVQLALIEVLNQQIEDAERECSEHIESDPDLLRDRELLRSFQGINYVSAAVILAEVGPISNYPDARSLAMAAGLAPIVFQSGTSYQCGLPKYGNARLRKGVYYSAFHIKRLDAGFQAFAKRIAGNSNKKKMTVHLAVMRKLIHSIWGVLHHQMPYDPAQAFPPTRQKPKG